MRKFTVFTVLLTIVVVVVLGQIIVDEYLPNLKTDITSGLPLMLPTGLENNSLGATNVLGADLGTVVEEPVVDEPVEADERDLSDYIDLGALSEPEEKLVAVPEQNFLIPENPSGLPDFEDPSFAGVQSVSGSVSVYIRDEQIKSAGFASGYLEAEPHGGLLFKTISIDDLGDVEIEKYLVRTADQLLAKVYVFKVGINGDVNEIYQVLRMKASRGLDVEINENNEFGSNSFYMNDSRRSDTAFLTVRVGSTIYAFSYPKEYHSQIKNLIQLLVWELG